MLVYFRGITSLLIYSPKAGSRLSYSLKTLLGEGLGVEFQLTTRLDEFSASDLPKINYSSEELKGALHINPHGILQERGIKDYHLSVEGHPQFEKVFFKTMGSEVPFDLFGAAFWLLSRYEEYLPHKADRYSRFHFRSSLAYQYDFIKSPLINVWLQRLKELLLLRCPTLQFTPRAYNFISSIDIDNAYQYRHKGVIRTLAGILADRDLKKIRKRFQIIFNRRPDPFDCYDFLIRLHSEKHVKAIFFLLLGDYGQNDKNHSASNLNFQVLIKHLADYSMVGIHPSFGSKHNLHQLKVETNRLTSITHRNITKSRQHFSLLKFPETYQDLLQAGILEDYSMGYTNFNGFRASYCIPFHWYNLQSESQSPLVIHPFVITENTLKDQAAREGIHFLALARPIIDLVKQHRGQLISIFHNDTFTEEMKRNYEKFIEIANWSSPL